MRKTVLLTIALMSLSIEAFAGGILTNTNLHAAFGRMLARGATFDIDGVYSNPAGMSFFKKEGLTMSFSWQNAYQKRNIDATFPLFPEENNRRLYKGTASAPIIPSLFAVLKHDK